MAQSFPPAVAAELQRLLSAVESKEKAVAALEALASGSASAASQHAQSASASVEAAADIVAAYVENLDAQRRFSLPAGGPEYPERVYIYVPLGIHVHYSVDEGRWYDALGNPVSEPGDVAPGVRRTIEDMELGYDETTTIEAGRYFGGVNLRFEGSSASGSASVAEEGGTLKVHGASEGSGSVTARVEDDQGRSAKQTFRVVVATSDSEAPVPRNFRAEVTQEPI